MFAKPSLITRITVAKSVGFLIGLIGFFAAPAFGIEDMKFRIGMLFWYTTVGAFIGLTGVFNWHPMLQMKMPWWLMGPMIGAWMNLLVILFAWDVLAPMMAGGAFWGATSPWWGLAEGAAIGFAIAGLATLFGGEGPETVRVVTPGA